MKIQIESKELKSLLEKVIPVVYKKANFKPLQCVLLKSENGKLSATTTDSLETWLTVNTSDYTSIEDGSVLIHESELKLITKLSGELEILKSENKTIVKSSKKSISIESLDVEEFPKYFESKENVELFTIPSNDFNNAIGKLINFTANNENNKMMQCYNINPIENRIEALDGHRIGIIDVVLGKTLDSESIRINRRINSDLKKVLNSKSFNQLEFVKEDKYINISGEDFTYSQKIVDGEYYKINQMLSNDYEFKLVLDKSELQEISKFNIDIVKVDCKNDKVPMIFNFNNLTNQHHIYINTVKHQTVDKFEIKKIDMKKDLTIAFNPTFIYEALKCMDNEEVTIAGNNSKAPILISGIGERYLILPVNIKTDIEDIKRDIEKAA